MIKNIMRNIKEMFRDKSNDINDAQSYRTDSGDIVGSKEGFYDDSVPEHISMNDSTAIDSIKYNKKDGVATVTFRNGSKSYDYPGVSPEEMSQMKGATSKGRAFHSIIKPHSTNQ